MGREVAKRSGMASHPMDKSTILVVGNLKAWEREGRVVPALEGFRFVEYSDLGEALLRGEAPEMVLSALMGDDYDALDVARRLDEIGFRGHYLALAEVLPNAAVVREEVKAVAPEVQFDLLVLNPLGSRH